jgi:hypothetical protein
VVALAGGAAKATLLVCSIVGTNTGVELRVVL